MADYTLMLSPHDATAEKAIRLRARVRTALINGAFYTDRTGAALDERAVLAVLGRGEAVYFRPPARPPVARIADVLGDLESDLAGGIEPVPGPVGDLLMAPGRVDPDLTHTWFLLDEGRPCLST
jgi:hypothetical protein